MPQQRDRLVVIGNGMVSLRFLEELLARVSDRYAVTVIGAEPRPAYNRISLSALLAEDVTAHDIAYRPRGWYAAMGIDLRTCIRAERIDRDNRRVALSDGTSVPFDRAVIVTGSNPIRLPLPGGDLTGVATFRDAADVDRIKSFARAAKNAVVIGGGLLGLEAAYGLNQLGVSTTVVHLMGRLMERQLDGPAADMLRTALEAIGITIRLNAETKGFHGDGTVSGIEFANGDRLAAELVIVSAGVRPATEVARASGIGCAQGILVDDRLQTDTADIYAIGECAQHQGTCYGLVEPGYEQATVLAGIFAGEDQTYAGSTVSTNLKVSGVDVFSAGDFMADSGGDAVSYSDPVGGEYRKLVISEGRVTGAILVGNTEDSLYYRDLISSGDDYSHVRTDLIFGRAVVEARAA